MSRNSLLLKNTVLWIQSSWDIKNFGLSKKNAIGSTLSDNMTEAKVMKIAELEFEFGEMDGYTAESRAMAATMITCIVRALRQMASKPIKMGSSKFA